MFGDAYLSYLGRRKAGAARTYRRFLVEFGDWAGERELHQISAADIENGFLARWQATFAARRGAEPSPSTQRNCIQALRSLYSWAERMEYLVDGSGTPVRNPLLRIESVRPKRQIKPWLTNDEFDRLVAAAAGSRFQQFLVLWLGCTGLRISEANSVLIPDLDLVSGVIVVRSSKTSAGARVVPIADELRPCLLQWLETRRQRRLDRPGVPVLCTGNGHGVSEQQAWRTLNLLAAKAEIGKRVGPHTLRRTFASRVLNAGMRIEALSAILGHADPSITARAYAELRQATLLAEARNALNGR